jgi:alcohol dehydrogenase class IV
LRKRRRETGEISRIEVRAEYFVDALQQLSEDLNVPQRLSDVGIPESALPFLASEAMKQTRLLVNNLRTVTEAEALAIYKIAF